MKSWLMDVIIFNYSKVVIANFLSVAAWGVVWHLLDWTQRLWLSSWKCEELVPEVFLYMLYFHFPRSLFRIRTDPGARMIMWTDFKLQMPFSQQSSCGNATGVQFSSLTRWAGQPITGLSLTDGLRHCSSWLLFTSSLEDTAVICLCQGCEECDGKTFFSL